MDKKLVITALYNEKKPIKYEQPLFKEKDGGMYMNFTESIITQMVKARDEDRFKAICERIQEFIEREGIDVCFAINQNELLDCLDEHQKLKLQIEQLEHRLSNCIEPKFKVGQEVYFLDWDRQIKIGKVENISYLNSRDSLEYEINYGNGYDEYEGDWFGEKIIYTTEEEAKAKLEEIKDGNL